MIITILQDITEINKVLVTIEGRRFAAICDINMKHAKFGYKQSIECKIKLSVQVEVLKQRSQCL
jgi:hypothetical protein